MNKFAKILALSDNKVKMDIYGEIVNSQWDAWIEEDVCPQDIQDMMKGLQGYEEVELYINSPGGSVTGGIAIHNILKRHPGHKTAIVDGVCASISTILAMACDKIVINKGAFFMIHEPWIACASGNADELEKYASNLKKKTDEMVEIYKTKLKKDVSEAQLRQMMKDETWINGNDLAKIFENVEVVGTDMVAKIEITDSFKNYKNVPDFILNKREVETVKKEEIISAIAKLSKEDAEVVAKVFQPKTVDKTVDEIRAEVKAEMQIDAQVATFLAQNNEKIKPAIKDKVEIVAKALAERGELENFEAIFADVKDSLILEEVATGGEVKALTQENLTEGFKNILGGKK